MIDSTIKMSPVQNNNQKNHEANQLVDIETSLAQFQSLSSFQGSSSSPLLKSLLELIQNIIAQLNQTPSKKSSQEATPKKDAQQEKSFEQPIKKDASNDELGPNDILGTAGNDKIEGTRHNDVVYAKTGDDRVYGRQGDDILSGQQGNDALYGGQGNDTLYGGQGNDYLSGGSGDNNLFGGAGDDTLYHRRGSDVFDGGSGNDTARIRASIEDYSVTLVAGQKNDSGITLTNNKTGQTVEVVNVENFKFDDARLSLDEMKQRANPVPIETKPSEAKPIEIKPIETKPNVTSAENNTSNLVFSESDKKIIGKHVFSTHRPSTSFHNSVSYDISIADSDQNGKVSAGDTLTLVANSKGMEGTVISEPVTLTSDQAEGINKDIDQRKTLVENKAKWEAYDFNDYAITGKYEPAGSHGRAGVTGKPIEAEPDIRVANGEVLNPRENSFTVGNIFEALEKNVSSSARYNEKYGYPESAFIPSSSETPEPSIKVSLLEQYRGEPVGDRGFGDNHGSGYTITNFKPFYDDRYAD